MKCPHCGRELEQWSMRTRFLYEALRHDDGRSGSPGWVYIVRSDDHEDIFKIGMTIQSDPFNRIMYLDNDPGAPYAAGKVCAIGKTSQPHKVERILHKVFGDKHLKREWFRLTPEDIEWIFMTMTFARTMTQFEELYMQ